MKRILATLALLLGALHILSAIPAYPGKIRVTQPDGSVITIRLHGDEWFHYATDEKGQVVARGKDKFFRPAEMPSRAVRAEAEEMRQAAQRMRAQAAQASGLTIGTHRIPVILVEFQDTRFTIDNPKAAFDALLNEEGYSDNSATGSVHDFYAENSHGLYDPVFEVFGPYLLSKDSKDYVNNAGGALSEACKALDGEIDFTRYDSDKDGNVDMTLMYYAGHNAAETGLEDEQIWPHQGQVYGGNKMDGKYLGTYFCTSELKGTGSRMCGIGTTTHEFAHSLGLPDFYDTDYETNGEASGLFSYSTMCSGAYNNNGRTPPYFNVEELMMLGWMDGLTEIEKQGDLTIAPVQNRIAYKVPTSMDGEYFVLECRAKAGWDKYLPGSGLLVYHVDKSQRQVSIIQYGQTRNYTAASLWNNWRYTNAINENASHPCFYIVPAFAQQSLTYNGDESRIPFPGTRNITKYTPVDWDGVESEFKFTDITTSNDGAVTLTVSYTTTPGISGRVMNTSARPVRGATVTLYADGSAKKRVTTDADGLYSFSGADMADATFTLKVSCSGYETEETEVTVGRKVETVDIYLRKEGESSEVTFSRYDPAGTMEGFGDELTDIAAAIQLRSEELAPYVGKQLKTISFRPEGGAGVTATAAYVFVEAGGRRRWTQKVDNLRMGVMNTVNVVSQEYYIPSGTSIYIGYALQGCTSEEPVTVQPCTQDNMGYYGRYTGGAISWKEMVKDNQYYTPVLSASIGEPVQAELGFNYISNPGNGSYKAGERFNLTLVRYEDDAPSTVAWKFDGQSVQADSVSLTAGSHTVEAHLTYPDGSREVIRLSITAE